MMTRSDEQLSSFDFRESLPHTLNSTQFSVDVCVCVTDFATSIKLPLLGRLLSF